MFTRSLKLLWGCSKVVLFLTVFCCMSLIAATRAEGGLVKLHELDVLFTGTLKSSCLHGFWICVHALIFSILVACCTFHRWHHFFPHVCFSFGCLNLFCYSRLLYNFRKYYFDFYVLNFGFLAIVCWINIHQRLLPTASFCMSFFKEEHKCKTILNKAEI